MTAIRRATPADIEPLAALRWEFRAGKDAPTEDRAAFLARCGAWMAGELRSGRWLAWVAERDGRIVGHVWLHPISKIPNPNGELERHAYVSNVYVTPSARGGIGTQLLDAALGWAAANHVDRVVLWPTKRSRTLYARHGFTPQGEVMEKTVGA